MILKKWNYKTHQYDDYEVSDNWNCKTYSYDMGEIVNCPHCGKPIPFGYAYTSLEIHTPAGFGYAVCDQCYEDEWQRRREAETE